MLVSELAAAIWEHYQLGAVRSLPEAWSSSESQATSFAPAKLNPALPQVRQGSWGLQPCLFSGAQVVLEGQGHTCSGIVASPKVPLHQPVC